MRFIAVIRHAGGASPIRHEFRSPLERILFMRQRRMGQPGMKVRLTEHVDAADKGKPFPDWWFGTVRQV